MRILGIETSCDETAAAVVEDGRRIVSNVVASQIPVHERFGGVVPEVASRQHVDAIDHVAVRALTESGFATSDIDAVAATFGPGLSGPLLVGTSFAKGLALATGLPLLAVNHIEGHVLSVWLSANDPLPDEPPLPMVSLVASGGHTELLLIAQPGVYRRLGRTVDDAVGEAFDKVGRLLGLPYPGGPHLERAAARGWPKAFVMPRAWLPGSYDFSFSGLKTAANRMIRELAPDDDRRLDGQEVADLASAFQDSVSDVLSRKLADAVAETAAVSAAIVGGVANNEAIRAAARERLDVPLFTPEVGLSSDNAAMIAGAAFWNPRVADIASDIDSNMNL